MLMSACMMLDHINQGDVADKIRASIRKVLENKIGLTPDLGGEGTTKTITEAIINNL